MATGSYTRDGKIVIGHNYWTNYMDGAQWRIIYDLVPAKGHRILMDGLPGVIHSGDDFGVNSAGIVITETTISQFTVSTPKVFRSLFVHGRRCSIRRRSMISSAS